jgi:hypothetical protein
MKRMSAPAGDFASGYSGSMVVFICSLLKFDLLYCLSETSHVLCMILAKEMRKGA